MLARIDNDGFAIPNTPEKVKEQRKRERKQEQEQQSPQVKPPKLEDVSTPKKCRSVKSAKLDEVSPDSKMIISVLDDLKNPTVAAAPASAPASAPAPTQHVFNAAGQLSVRVMKPHEFSIYHRPKMMAVVKIGNGAFSEAVYYKK